MTWDRCMPTHNMTLVLVNSDGTIIDDATEHDVITYLVTGSLVVDSESAQRDLDGRPASHKRRFWLCGPTQCDVATIEWHDSCDPDSCPLGACGYVPHVIDERAHHVQIARDAAIEGRTAEAIAILRSME